MRDLANVLIHFIATIAKLARRSVERSIVAMKCRNARFGCRRIAKPLSFVFGFELDMKRLMITCLALAPSIGSAHHSPANFDLEVTDFEVTGRIASVSFRNPHSVIRLLVDADDGTTSEWYVEFSSVNLLLRRGWDLDRVESGDIVTCIGNPSAHEAPEMYMWTIRLDDGTEFSR